MEAVAHLLIPDGEAEPEPDLKKSRTDVGPDAPGDADEEEEEELKEPCISVIMPVRNGMPWLPDAVQCILSQEGLEDEGGLELLVVNDSSTDGSLAWLKNLEGALQDEDRKVSEFERRERKKLKQTQLVHDGALFGGFDADRLGWVTTTFIPPTISQVVNRRRKGNTMRILEIDAYGPCGQGKAMNTAFTAARANIIGEMEADDLRPPFSFIALYSALSQNPHWDGVTSTVALIGKQEQTMGRWMEWQNALTTPVQMSRARFLEIPSIRASGLYRRSALLAVALPAEEPYRDLWLLDGQIVDCAHTDDPRFEDEEREHIRPTGWWPIDADFWMRWYMLGLTTGKIKQQLYLWRQYPQQNPLHFSRISQERLRSCKIHFMLAEGGVCRGRAIQVWGTGETLQNWVQDLRAELIAKDGEALNEVMPVEGLGDTVIARLHLLQAAAEAAVMGIEYKPGTPVNFDTVNRQDELSRTGLRAVGCTTQEDQAAVKLFAFGMEKAFGMDKARRKVVASFSGFDEDGDDHWFVS